MNNILVPTDFSTTATKALHFALMLAKNTGDTIILCHVYTPVESTFIDTEERRRQHNEDTRTALHKQLQELTESVSALAPEVVVRTCVVRSPMVASLIETAEKQGCRMIAMGTHGATGMKKVMIGSVAAAVAEASPIPVLLVPEQYRIDHPRQIVFATNFNEYETAALEQTIALTQSTGAALTLVHVCPAAAGPVEFGEEERQFHTFIFPFQERHPGVPLTLKLLCSDEPFDTLERLEQAFPYDLLVLVKRKKGLLEGLFSRSLPKNMAYATTQPLLVMPAAT